MILLADEIDWVWLDDEIAEPFCDDGRPGTQTRFMIGVLLLKHIHELSDEGVFERWVENPYYQYFTRETYFRHDVPHERSSLSHWRTRIGDTLDALLAESLRVAHEIGALMTDDLARITVDTTVQPKNVTHPTAAKLMLTAIEQLGALARAHEVPLRQSYVRVSKRAALMAERYAHAKQFKRCNRELRFLRTRLGRLIRDIRRKTEGDNELEQVFAVPLGKAMQIRQQQRGWKPYSWHAPETECIGNGKAHKPYEFGIKISIATTNQRCKGGQFILHAKALPGNPYDGHTLAAVIDEDEALTGREIERVYVDKGHRDHKVSKPLSVLISGQKRGVFGAIKRELRRGSAIEAIIGHMKTDGHLDRSFLKDRDGDHANAVLTAVGYNLRLVLKWLRAIMCQILVPVLTAMEHKIGSQFGFLTVNCFTG